MIFIHFAHNFSFFVFLILGIYILLQKPKAALNRAVFGLMLMFAVWSLSMSFINTIHTGKAAADIIIKISNFSAIAYSLFTFISVGLFTKKIKLNTWFYALSGIYIVSYSYFEFNNMTFGISHKNSLGFWEVSSLNYTVIAVFNTTHNSLIILSFIFLCFYLRKTSDRLKQKQIKIILITGLISYIISSLNIFIPIIFPAITLPNLVDVCLLIFAFGLVYAIAKYDMFKLTPTLLLEQIIETMPFGFILTDENKTIVRVNHWISEKLHKPSSRFIDRPLANFAKQYFSDQIRLNSDNLHIQQSELHVKDEKRAVMIYEKPISDQYGRTIASVLMINDIEQLIAAEKKLLKQNLLLDKKVKERTTELLSAKNRAEESDRLKTAFLNNLSHEIRTPLNAVCGFSSMLNDENINQNKRNSFISIIQNSSEQLLSIVTDILNISSLQTGQETLHIENTNINEIILKLFAKFKFKTHNNVSLHIKTDLPDSSAIVQTDKDKLSEILKNLLSNACKFTRKGSIEFGYTKADSRHSDSAIELQFFVSDTGIGISADRQQKIFEPFRQADQGIQQNYGGTGLGLSIAKGYTELLGSCLKMQSEEGKGSRFFFTIPLKPIRHITKS